MNLLKRIKRKFYGIIRPQRVMKSSEAYDLWASSYDDQPDNLIVYLDEQVFTGMINKVDVKGKTVLDFGCGTGRHWKKVFEKEPGRLVGYDVSKEMLSKLAAKYPGAETYLATNTALKELSDSSCDLLISSLVIGHIDDLGKTFFEWNRVLKNGGNILITDFHPDALKSGSNRSFCYNDQVVIVKNYIHSLDELKDLSGKLNWELINLIERKIDAGVKRFYEKGDAMQVYKESFDSPILYGCHFRKPG